MHSLLLKVPRTCDRVKHAARVELLFAAGDSGIKEPVAGKTTISGTKAGRMTASVAGDAMDLIVIGCRFQPA
ncbi:hypothetical protein ECZU51_29120 [Escherichia coli]|nr:hypothetical protein ECZU51_29120 [Escherichia coli]